MAGLVQERRVNSAMRDAVSLDTTRSSLFPSLIMSASIIRSSASELEYMGFL